MLNVISGISLYRRSLYRGSTFLANIFLWMWMVKSRKVVSARSKMIQKEWQFVLTSTGKAKSPFRQGKKVLAFLSEGSQKSFARFNLSNDKSKILKDCTFVIYYWCTRTRKAKWRKIFWIALNILFYTKATMTKVSEARFTVMSLVKKIAV